MSLEVVRIICKSLEVAGTKVASPSFKCVTEGKCAERRIAARAAATNCQSLTIGQPPLDKIFSPIHTIIDIDHTPLTLEPLAVCTSIACATSVIDIENCEASTGPELDFQIESARRGRRWTSMTDYQQRRLVIGVRFKIGVTCGIGA